MGVRARRWQLWLITMFVLTGIIGMIQLFKEPEPAGAISIAGGAVNSSIGMPSRSAAEQATQLPAWTPTDDTSADAPGATTSRSNDVPRVAAAITPRIRATQLPSSSVTPATKNTGVQAKTVTTTASPATAKPTTRTAAATATKAGSTATKATTSAAKPTPTTVRKTTAAPTTSRTQQPPPRCYRILWWVHCR